MITFVTKLFLFTLFKIVYFFLFEPTHRLLSQSLQVLIHYQTQNVFEAFTLIANDIKSTRMILSKDFTSCSELLPNYKQYHIKMGIFPGYKAECVKKAMLELISIGFFH